ncbi:restriction endonuclease-like protein [Psychrobacillus sp. NEAU-3TGS]|uniref:restriction endonuclease-like protein n=1 Tax=Psychrobacillus sp. NEAU-3TGS TaxID=2995412 RepID=UPI0024991C11|nr:restriction endonuclease-like protein [Psychrobacillus sp. NEAU-3TGS]MDI2587262.1 restriction endonuclease-like protein [Psychrobacillus sp. NEAU-3TGS]
MVSLPSGSLKNVELLCIETDVFTLVVKGDLNLERYQNKFVPYSLEDRMQFRYEALGKVNSVEILDAQMGELVPYTGQDLPPIFFENGYYQVIIEPAKGREVSFFHEYAPFREAVTKTRRLNFLSGTLHFQNEVGLSSFEIREEDTTLLDVLIEVFPTKLDYKTDYKDLLFEVQEELYNLAYQFVQRTYVLGEAKYYQDPSLGEFYRLFSAHIENYAKAIDQIERMPHHQLTKQYIEVRGERLRKQDSHGYAYLRKNARQFTEVPIGKGIDIAGKNLMPIKGLLTKKEQSFDTLENRYVKWTMQRITSRLHVLIEVIEKTRKSKDKTFVIPLELVRDLKAIDNRMQKRLNSSFWLSIGKLDRQVHSLVLQMAPGYREVHQIYAILAQSIVLQAELYKMSLKSIWKLYEYWTFLKLGKILSETCHEIKQNVIEFDSNGLYVNLKDGQRVERTFEHKITGETISLVYQYDTGKSVPTVQQKPDSMLSIAKKGKDYEFQYIFDAKYKIDFSSKLGPAPKQEDINTMHRYRDAIVVANNGAYERTAFGAYVLFPWKDMQGFKKHPLYKSIDSVNIGGLPFLPNATDLVSEVIYNLLNKNGDELLKEGILPIGVLEPKSTSLDNLALFIKTTSYDFSERKLEIKKYDLPAKFSQVTWLILFIEEEGRIEHGKVVGQRETTDKIIFEVDTWVTLTNIDVEDVRVDGNFMTTKTSLVEANRLHDLFVRSELEYAVWRALRRVSRDIVVDLDSQVLSDDCSVIAFHFAGHRFTLQDNILMVGEERISEQNIFEKPYQVVRAVQKLLS